MLINNNKEYPKDLEVYSGVKFISYSGDYPALCGGILEIEVFGIIYRFGNNLHDKSLMNRFWNTGGSCGFTDNDDTYIEKSEWEIDVNRLPDILKGYAADIDKVFNANVPYGCCGGCL
jgi:hypothetical protein